MPHPSVAVYPNLALVESFQRDLNYTGFIADGWNDPINLVPIILTVLCLLFGRPRSLLAWWVLVNTAIIHPMDLFVGFLGWGPKYLSDEYAVLDSRYWPLQDPVVGWVSWVELVLMLPLCLLWYKGIVQGEWYRHFYALVASSFQMMGTIMYMGCEVSEGYKHIPAYDWPPTFNSYLKLKYFWLVFVGLNTLWIVVPAIIMLSSYQELQGALHKKKTN